MLKRFVRKIAPKDGGSFRTLAHLGSLIRCMGDEYHNIPPPLSRMWVPVLARLDIEHAEDSDTSKWKANFCLLDDLDRQWFNGHSPYHVNMSRDSRLRSKWYDQWIYVPLAEGPHAYDCPEAAPGEDVSIWECSLCGQTLYHERYASSQSRVAVEAGGEMRCRSCEIPGVQWAPESLEMLEKCRRLADAIGGNARASLEDRFRFLELCCKDGNKNVWISNDGDYAFYFVLYRMHADGPRTFEMNGGVIFHGPKPTVLSDGTFSFATYDYARKAYRPATPEEVACSYWGMYT